MNFIIDDEYNKVIQIPLIDADTIADNFKDLQGVILANLDTNDELYDIRVLWDEVYPIGVVVIYKELMKPNILFKFSKNVQDEILNGNDPEYWVQCKLFYYVQNGISYIRVTKPFNIISNESLLKNG